MSVRKQILAALCTSVCCTSLALSASAAGRPTSAVAAEAVDIPQAASPAEGEEPAPERLRRPVATNESVPEEKDEDINQRPAEPSQPSPGPSLRRLNNRSRKASKAVGGSGWGSALILLGSLLSGAAIWRKTSEIFHSPKQAFRKAKMRLLGHVPPSWDNYVRSLPVLDELEFPELRPLLKRLEKKPVVLMSVPKPSTRLSAFLGLTEEQREDGIVIKGKATNGCSAKEVAFELFAHEKLAKGLPLSLPALGVYRDFDGSTLYLVTPRARADVALYTRRMPDKVNIRLAFAEMIYGLWGMHKMGWVHRDIKGCNYFVSQDGHALLADFEGFWRNGMHAIMYGEEVEIIFTEHYIAPELTFDGEYQVFDYKSDVYALGVSFREMLEWMGETPVPQKDLALDLVSHMVEPDIKKRYDLQQCMHHPYFLGIEFDQLDKHPYGKAFEGNYMTPYKFL